MPGYYYWRMSDRIRPFWQAYQLPHFPQSLYVQECGSTIQNKIQNVKNTEAYDVERMF